MRPSQAPNPVMDLLGKLAEENEYGSVQEVLDEIGNSDKVTVLDVLDFLAPDDDSEDGEEEEG